MRAGHGRALSRLGANRSPQDSYPEVLLILGGKTHIWTRAHLFIWKKFPQLQSAASSRPHNPISEPQTSPFQPFSTLRALPIPIPAHPLNPGGEKHRGNYGSFKLFGLLFPFLALKAQVWGLELTVQPRLGKGGIPVWPRCRCSVGLWDLESPQKERGTPF